MNTDSGSDGHPYFEAVRQGRRKVNPFFGLMGIQVGRLGEGDAVLEMEVRPDMLNGAGWLQGGLFVSLVDEAMALALASTLDATQRMATVSETTAFIKGARDGKLVAAARIVKRGRRMAFLEGEVREGAEDGELLARTSAVFAVMS